jgi:hypothetical protein
MVAPRYIPARRQRRKSFFLKRVPADYEYCVMRDPGRPLVCLKTFQGALEEADIPLTQGKNLRGSARHITCGRTGGAARLAELNLHRKDGLIIQQVQSCKNLTQDNVWTQTGWQSRPGGLSGMWSLPQSGLGWAALAGVAVVAGLVYKEATTF